MRWIPSATASTSTSSGTPGMPPGASNDGSNCLDAAPSGLLDGILDLGKRAVEGLALDPDFWRGRRVLVTGHTGFKGAWLSIWLADMGADVVGIALKPATIPNLFDSVRIEQHIRSFLVDIKDRPAVEQI